MWDIQYKYGNGEQMSIQQDRHSDKKTWAAQLKIPWRAQTITTLNFSNQFFTCLLLYLVAVEFLILEGDNLNKLFPNKVFKIGSLAIEGKKGFVVITSLIILPTWLRSLGLLTFVSVGGVVASVILVCSVFWVAAIDGVGFHEG